MARPRMTSLMFLYILSNCRCYNSYVCQCFLCKIGRWYAIHNCNLVNVCVQVMKGQKDYIFAKVFVGDCQLV